MPTTYAAAVSLADSMFIAPSNPHGWVLGFYENPAKFLQDRCQPYADAGIRLTRSNERLLAALREGPKTNVELMPICGMRVSGRVFDLRRHGYAIKATPGVGGLWTYELEERR